jgi:hypothetical protein
LLLAVAALAAVVGMLPSPALAASYPLEDFAPYQPATRCVKKAQPGTVMFGRFVVQRFGGGFGPIHRRCGGSRSEHTEGRAFDWTNDAATKAGRARVARFLRAVLHDGPSGEHAVAARRMGIMYIIWYDRMYAAWDRFRPRFYLSSSCTSLKRCSKTLRHRDHVHISLTRQAAQRQTSWYLYRMSK